MLPSPAASALASPVSSSSAGRAQRCEGMLSGCWLMEASHREPTPPIGCGRVSSSLASSTPQACPTCFSTQGKSEAQPTPKQPQEHVEQDATMAASALYDNLHNGFYHTTEGARHPIAGDLTKIPFPAGIAAQQNRLLADFRFRTRLVPATQGIPTTLGHIRSVLDNYPVWQ